MKFEQLKECLYNGKVQIVPFKTVALDMSNRNVGSDMESLVHPIIIVAKQNDLRIAVNEYIDEYGEKMLEFCYDAKDIIKALHILNVSVTLN